MISKRQAYRYAVDIFLPNRCGICDKVIRWDKLICEDCEKNAELIENCCRGTELGKMYGVFEYKDDIRKLIMRLKHMGDVDNFAEFCAVKLAETLEAEGLAQSIDIVTAVPMHRSKRLRRGRDQARVIAKFVSGELGKQTDFSLLERTADTTEQHKLDKHERKEHAEKIYRAAGKAHDLTGKRVLICDDVITTGSTMRACSEQLKKLGAQEVICCSAAMR